MYWASIRTADLCDLMNFERLEALLGWNNSCRHLLFPKLFSNNWDRPSPVGGLVESILVPAWSSGCSELETMTAVPNRVLIEACPTRIAMHACVIAFNVHYCVTVTVTLGSKSGKAMTSPALQAPTVLFNIG